MVTPYRPGQGIYARSAAGVAALVLALFGCFRLFQQIRADAKFTVLGMDVQYGAVWAGGAFIAIAAIVFLFTFGVRTGIKALDAKSHRLVDLLIDTESELNKVSWPNSDELSRSTMAVVVSIILLGTFLFAIDQVLVYIMGLLRVLP